MMIGLCTDSNSQLPDVLRTRYSVQVVPLTVSIDGVDYAEGEDLDADAFYQFFSGRVPTFATAAPSPGVFLDAYRALAAAGAEEILSIHLGSQLSATFGSARLAAADSPVPVRLVDTGTASFGISCCLWHAAEALVDGATIDEAAVLAETLTPRIGNVFVVGALDLVRRGGRLAPDVESRPDSISVLSLIDGRVQVVDSVTDLGGAVRVMAQHLRGVGSELNVAVGIADADGAELSEALADELSSAAEVLEVVRYRIGPSVGVHTGPGTAGGFAFPSRRR